MDKLAHFLVGCVGAGFLRALGVRKEFILIAGFGATVAWETLQPPADGWDWAAGMAGVAYITFARSPTEVDREIERIRKEVKAQTDTAKGPVALRANRLSPTKGPEGSNAEADIRSR